MKNKKAYIELNGTRYDAHSGEVLKSSESSHLVPENAPIEHFVPVEASQAANTPSGSGVIDGLKHRPSPVKHHRSTPQKSKTLMRPAVSKPKIQSQPAVKPTKANSKIIISKDHQARIERAERTKKSSIISRFHEGGLTLGLTKRTISVPVVATPKKTALIQPAHQENIAMAAAQSVSHTSHRFEQAIENATSHLNQHHPHKKSRKRKAVGASTLAVLLFAGFFAYQNVPNIEMRVASSRAGFSASLPGYSPAGFGIAGPIEAEAGKVTVTFKSRTDNKSFQVRQQVSEWSSSSLLSNYADNKKELRSYPDERGRTLYIYEGSNVTWVDAGIWYDVQGNASLTDDQLLRIANSL